jgi:hypothetical protein
MPDDRVVLVNGAGSRDEVHERIHAAYKAAFSA